MKATAEPLERDDVRDLLRGAFDLHVHSAPDLLPRSGTDDDFAREAREHGMAGLALKSHFGSTASRARLAELRTPGVRVVGMVTLNHPVGGLNAVAVDAAAREGARIAMLPTIDAANERGFAHPPDLPEPFWARAARDLAEHGITRPPISVVGEDGRLTADALDVLEIARAHHVTIATGHLGAAEVAAIVATGRELGVRVVVTHPEFPSTALGLSAQRELAAQGAMFERCCGMYLLGKASWGELIHTLRELGTESTIFSSDLGQANRPRPVQGMAALLATLLDEEFPVDAIRRAVADNPAEIADSTAVPL